VWRAPRGLERAELKEEKSAEGGGQEQRWRFTPADSFGLTLCACGGRGRGRGKKTGRDLERGSVGRDWTFVYQGLLQESPSSKGRGWEKKKKEFVFSVEGTVRVV